MAKKLSQKQLAEVRAAFLAKREELLQERVSGLQQKLFDMVFEKYLSTLETENGRIISRGKNISIVQGLDAVYKEFRNTFNSQGVKQFLSDMQGINAQNEVYFRNIAKKDIRTTTEKAKAAMNKALGLTPEGKVKKDGFTDKFLRDDSVNKKIKKTTMRALTNGTGFQEFRQQLKEVITGIPDKKNTGALHQYYRNYAYDTYQKVDRLNGDVFAKNIGLRYFIYNGGIIKTSREFCKHYNGTIVDSVAFAALKKEDLPISQQDGIPDEGWQPLIDMGGHGCLHRKDWITDDIAIRNKEKFAERADARRLELQT